MAELKLPLCIIKHHALKACQKMEIKLHILNLNHKWECSASQLTHFTPKERDPGPPFCPSIGRLDGP